MTSTIGQRLAAGLVLPLLILLVFGVMSFRALGGLLETSAWVRHTYEVLEAVGSLEGKVTEAASWQRAYLVTGNEDYAARYRASILLPGASLERFRELTVDNPVQQRRVEPLRALIAEFVESSSKRTELRRTKGVEAVEGALPLADTVRLSEQILEKARELRDEETRLLKGRTDASEAQGHLTRGVILWGSLAGFAVVLAWGLLISRSITGPVMSGTQSLVSSVGQILAATTQQAAGTQEEATAIQETSTTVQELRQTAQLASQKAHAVAELVQKTSATSEDGRRATEEALAGMRESKVRMEGIARRVLDLSEQGQKIADIITTVQDLAEQSNLLSVNAAIEAARAGEAGRGFAVVASEVKALAEQSKQATAQVRQILGEVQRATQGAVLATEQGVKASEAGEVLARRTGEAIETLNDSLSQAAQAAQQIQVTAQEQAAGVDQVALAMSNIKQVSVQSVSATREMEAAAQDLNGLAQRLRALVSRSPNGTATRSSAPPA